MILAEFYILMIFRSKQEKMGVELERLNTEHAMESRQDCQELVRFILKMSDTFLFIEIDFYIFTISTVLYGQRTNG